MNIPQIALPHFIRALPIAWNRRSERERAMLVAAAVVVGLLLVWSIALRPALRTLSTADTTRTTLETQLQSMLAMQAQAKTLQAQPRMNASSVAQSLSSAVEPTFGKNARILVAGNQATLTVNAVSAKSLAQWLAYSRINAQSKPTSVQISSASSPDGNGVVWSGTLQMSVPTP